MRGAPQVGSALRGQLLSGQLACLRPLPRGLAVLAAQHGRPGPGAHRPEDALGQGPAVPGVAAAAAAATAAAAGALGAATSSRRCAAPGLGRRLAPSGQWPPAAIRNGPSAPACPGPAPAMGTMEAAPALALGLPAVRGGWAYWPYRAAAGDFAARCRSVALGRRAAAFSVAVTAAVVVAADQFADAVQRLLIYHPPKDEVDIVRAKQQVQHARLALPKQGYQVQELDYSVPQVSWFPASRLKQRGFLIMPAAAAEPQSIAKLWVIFGGNAMVATDWLTFVEALIRARGAAVGATGGTARQQLPAFLLLDYPGYGANEGQPCAGLALRASEAGVQAALEALRGGADASAPETAAVSCQALAYLGHSLGAAAAAQLAARLAAKRPSWLGSTSPVSRLVLSAPFTSIPRLGEQLLGAITGANVVIALASTVSRHQWDNERSLRALAGANRPGDAPPEVTILHGELDEIVPVAMGRKLHGLCLDAGLRGSTLIERSQAGHNDILDEAFPDYARLVLTEGALVPVAPDSSRL